MAARNNSSPDDETVALERARVTAVTWNDAGYPARLKEIADPPAALFYKGTLLPSDERSVAIVGTRSPTTYGREAAALLSLELAQAGLTVVSGLALGIDGLAHRAALENAGRPLRCWPEAWTGCTQGPYRPFRPDPREGRSRE